MGEDPQPLEQEFDALRGVATEQAARCRGGTGVKGGHVLRREGPVRGGWKPPRAVAQQLVKVPGPPEEHGGVGRRLHDAAGRHPAEEPRGVPPGVAAVAATEDDRQGNLRALRAHLLEDELVPGEHPVGGDVPVPDHVVRCGVDARHVEHQPGAHLLDHGGQRLAERPEVGRVVHGGPERDDGRRHRVTGGPVLVVDGERMNRRVILEEEAGAVAVVDVEVDDQDRRLEPARAQSGDRDGQVVECAETHAPVRRGVVKPAAEIHGHQPGPQRGGGGEDGPAGRQSLELDEALRLDIGELGADDLFHDLGVLERLEVLVGVDPPEILHRGRLRAQQLPAADQPFVGEEGEHHLRPKRVHRDGADLDDVPGVIHKQEPRGSEAAPDRAPYPSAHPPAHGDHARLAHPKRLLIDQGSCRPAGVGTAASLATTGVYY